MVSLNPNTFLGLTGSGLTTTFMGMPPNLPCRENSWSPEDPAFSFMKEWHSSSILSGPNRLEMLCSSAWAPHGWRHLSDMGWKQSGHNLNKLDWGWIFSLFWLLLSFCSFLNVFMALPFNLALWQTQHVQSSSRHEASLLVWFLRRLEEYRSVRTKVCGDFSLVLHVEQVARGNLQVLTHS